MRKKIINGIAFACAAYVLKDLPKSTVQALLGGIRERLGERALDPTQQSRLVDFDSAFAFRPPSVKPINCLVFGACKPHEPINCYTSVWPLASFAALSSQLV